METKKAGVREMLGLEATVAFSSVSIKVASPDVIRSWSRGEVKNPETINYRTFKPEKGGLFCEKIFGPQRDWQCSCGKYKGQKHKGIVCDRCGVEVTHSRVRRERMGHIDLAVPVSHVWFFKCLPSRIGLMLDMTGRALERVIYYESWVVTDKGDTPLADKQLLTEDEYREAREQYGQSFHAGMGAEAIRELLAKLDLAQERELVEQLMRGSGSKTDKKKLGKRLRLVEGFTNAEMRPEWMILTVLPVIPPDLRPLVPLEGGRFATSDLNDLYRRVINRNNRLRNLLTLRTPEVIIRNEKRMLQEAVDALFDNGRQGRAVTGAGNRPLKSLSDMLKGKQGRFRQNLLGKRVDYSGRSVIVVGPELKLNQCGLPKKMALTLFEPFIIRRLKEQGFCHTVRSAKKMIERAEPQVWDILEEVSKGHPVLLNRAPTLHRLSIQAFDPVLIEGDALRIHPLVCTAYNADFDGDQMAVHVPLSNEAQLEAKLLMLAPNNIFYPSNGKPIATPSQDICLGAYYLTYIKPGAMDRVPHPRAYADNFEVLRAYQAKALKIHDVIQLRNPDFGTKTPWGDAGARHIKTTPGRVIFNDIWPRTMGFQNKTATKKDLGRLISDAYAVLGRENTVVILDRLKELGYEYATQAGFSIGINDMKIPGEKKDIIAKAHEEVETVRTQFQKGFITEQERRNKCIDQWTMANDQVAKATYAMLERNEDSNEINPIWAMLDSGARGSKDQVRQLAGMRGLMAKPSGDIIERPIIANFREGLSVLEFFVSSHGARKGLADTALKTADSGYMTRKLVDVAHDVICIEHDCQTTQGIFVSAIKGEGEEEKLPLADRLKGRFSADDIRDPLATEHKLIVASGEEITVDVAKRINACGIVRVKIRSVLTCRSENGICAKCYGRNLATDGFSQEGDAIGIVAAQSIGEPGTQLTMRTFHFGGAASASARQTMLRSKVGGILKIEDARTVTDQNGRLMVLNKTAQATINDDQGFLLERHQLVAGSTLTVNPGDKVKKDQIFVRWDPYSLPIISEHAGTVKFVDLIEGLTIKTQTNQSTGNQEIEVQPHREDLMPHIVINDNAGDMLAHYSIPAGALIMVGDGTTVTPGVLLARTPRQSTRTRDITGGLPRVSELFEARRPKNAAEIARIDGVITLGRVVRQKRTISITDTASGSREEHIISSDKHVVVGDGEQVRKGQPLTEGSIAPQEILEVCGPQDLQEFLVNEIQQVYRVQGVEINDKHIEVIVRQMLQKVKIMEAGDSRFLFGEQIERTEFIKENNRVISEGGKAAEAQPVLLGITKAALETDSFISAASFQDTTRILTDAATLGKVDPLKGFKENVIMGHLIPAGTGYRKNQAVSMRRLGKEIVSEASHDPAPASADASKAQYNDAIAALGLGGGKSSN